MTTPQFMTALLTSRGVSLVEFIEALTVVLALGAACSWRSALCGGAVAVVLLILLLMLFGHAVPVISAITNGPIKLVLGVLLLLFGTRWLRKATRRAAGLTPLRDEAASFQRHHERFAALGAANRCWDGTAGPLALRAAAIGAAFAFLVVCGLGLALRGPITRAPDNMLKRLISAMLAGLGTFWVGEGSGLGWPGDDLAILPLGGGFLILSVAGAAWLARADAAKEGGGLRRSRSLSAASSGSFGACLSMMA